MLRIASKQILSREIAKPSSLVRLARLLSIDDNIVVLDLHFEFQKVLPDRCVEHPDFIKRPVVKIAEYAQRKAVKAIQELGQIICANFFHTLVLRPRPKRYGEQFRRYVDEAGISHPTFELFGWVGIHSNLEYALRELRGPPACGTLVRVLAAVGVQGQIKILTLKPAAGI